MGSLRQWAFGLCGAAIACGLAQMILPESNLQKLFHITCSVFFLCCLLSPVILSPISWEPSVQEELQQQIEERAKRLSETLENQGIETLRQTARGVLDELGIDGGKIYINTHENETGGISISECEVQLDERYAPRHQEIREALRQRLGVQVLIGYQKE